MSEALALAVFVLFGLFAVSFIINILLFRARVPHLTTPDTPTTPRIECEACGKGFDDRLTARQHAYDVHNAPDEQAADYTLTTP